METNLYWLYNDDQADSDFLFGDVNGCIHITTL